MAKQLWCSDFLTPPTPLIIPHWLPAFLESLMPLKSWCSIYARCSKSSLKHSIRFCCIFFPSLKQNFIVYRFSKVSSRPDCIFEIHQLWQSDFSRVYSNCCCSCSFEREVIKIGQSSYNMYSNNIINFQVSTTILNGCTKKSLETYWIHHLSVQILVRLASNECFFKMFAMRRFVIKIVFFVSGFVRSLVCSCLSSSINKGNFILKKRKIILILEFFSLHCLKLLQSKNHFNLTKIFVLRLFNVKPVYLVLTIIF